jgi:MarR family transcriptional regulator for hemolysin
MEKLEEIIFYTMEKAIKSYRQLAQRNINQSGLDITIDQWLVMKALQSNTSVKQNELATTVFKDAASVTRIIDMLISKKYLVRAVHNNDRRRTELTITPHGKIILKKVQSIINHNRTTALYGINQAKIKTTREILSTIIMNCTN